MGRILVTVALLTVVAAACGDDDAVGPEVTDAWSRSSPAMQDAGVVYFTLTGGSERAVLSGVEVPTDVAAVAMLHESVMDDSGVMSMAPVIEVAAEPGETLAFEPGGYHVMMMELVEPLESGDSFEMTLVFSDGTSVLVPVDVRDE